MATSSKFITEWWLQRISAVVIAAYALLVIVLLLVNGAPNAAQWQGLFAHTGFKLATMLALIAALLRSDCVTASPALAGTPSLSIARAGSLAGGSSPTMRW